MDGFRHLKSHDLARLIPTSSSQIMRSDQIEYMVDLTVFPDIVSILRLSSNTERLLIAYKPI